MTEKHYMGQCLCGKIKYRAQDPTVWVGYCHCQSCRRATGASAVTYVGFNDVDVIFFKGNPKVFQSSDGINRGFCNDCGSPLTYQADQFPEYVQIHIGSFDNPEKFRPLAHVHYCEKIPWYEVDDHLPHFSGSAAEDGDSWKA